MSTLGIFMKQPVPGQVKTRLGAEIGYELSAELYQAFLEDLLERTQGIADQRVLAYGPGTDDARKYFESHAETLDILWSQPETNLGERMSAFINDYISDGPVVIIGSDSPSLPTSAIREAFNSLDHNSLDHKEIVIGPAMDGGYYLVGQSQHCPQMFEEIIWSKPNVLKQTMDKIHSAQHLLHLLPPWYDIDSLVDLFFLKGHLSALALAGRLREIPVRTFAILQQLELNELNHA